AAPPAEEAPARPSLPQTVDVAGLRKGLDKSRASEGFFGRLRALISGKKSIDATLATEIEEVLLTSDVGVDTTKALLETVRDGLSKGELTDSDKVWGALREQAVRVLETD